MHSSVLQKLGLALALLAALMLGAFACNGDDDDDDSNAQPDDDAVDDDDADDDDDDNDDTSPEGVVPTTLDLTLGPKAAGQSWELAEFPGEPHVERNDLNVAGGAPTDANRLSMTYFMLLTDQHMTDEEAPARLTYFDSNFVLDGIFEAAFRPEEDITGQILNAVVRTANRIQVDYGRDFDFAVTLGDSPDNGQVNELQLVIDVLSGAGLTSGDPGWARPDSGDLDLDQDTGRNLGERNFGKQESGDPFNRADYPNSNADFATPGLQLASGDPLPWFYVVGNHDVLSCGSLDPTTPLTFFKPEDYTAAWAPFGKLPGLGNTVEYWKDNPNQALHIDGGIFGIDLDWRVVMQLLEIAGMLDGWENDVFDGFDFLTFVNDTPGDGSDDGVAVTADLQREFLGRDASGSVALMRQNGHGFPDGTAYYRIDLGNDLGIDMPLRFLALNTNELLQLADGGVTQEQLNWLQDELDQAEADQVLVVVMSHHQEDNTPINGDALAAMLDASPNVILHLVGHGHDNRVTPLPSGALGDGYGRWEIETASTADFPQQSRILEIVDNRDGTGTIYATLFDHWTVVGDDADTLAALGRELAFADWLTKGWDGTGAFGGMGEANDRNVALKFAIPDEIADKLADIPSDGTITSTDVLGHLYEQ